MSDGRDEKTQEIVVPVRTAPRSNIVHVNFSARKSSTTQAANSSTFSRAYDSARAGEKLSFEPRRRRPTYNRSTDTLSPWLIRGMVLFAVLLLSLLLL